LRAEAEAKQASAVRGEAEARLAEVERGTRNERITQSRAQLAGAEAAFDEAATKFERTKALATQNLVSREALDSARADRDRAAAERNRLKAQLAELEHGATSEELQQARAAFVQAQAAERAANITLERLTVRAPSPGRIDALPFDIGERPVAGAVVAVLLTGAQPYARVYVPEPVRARVSPGTAAQVYVDGIEKPFTARVRSVSSDPVFTPFFSLTEHDRQHLSYLAEVVIEGAQNLAAGVPVEVVFQGTSQ
jgi:HlyD family secretion protein